ncbi:hypothetical protein FAI41_03865 [Acetobacteraceae bacterium]|nr:hypothetical protein FAI41_03865 [Acetobacteraceae bacterium]
MKIWLRTRGVTHDYAFLGEVPQQEWWAEGVYKNFTSFEQPTLILELFPSGKWECFISAIPSERCDRLKTQIRYSLVLSGDGTDQEILFKLLGEVLQVFRKHPPEIGSLTKFLDEAVGEQADKWLEKKPETQNQVEQCLIGLKKKFSQLTPFPLEEKIRSIFEKNSDSKRIVALLNFIASSEDPLAEELKNALWGLEQCLIGLKKKFSQLVPFPLEEKIRSIFEKNSDSERLLVALFNFIASLEDSLAEDLKIALRRSVRDQSHCCVLLPSPLAGGDITLPFFLDFSNLENSFNREIEKRKMAVLESQKMEPENASSSLRSSIFEIFSFKTKK